ncbi:hypothetical protein GOV06_05170, partial [Candidatus Woesearchaeota archaeon]|nr:hypothetical protein [Candidatus Woesearchaeota archaeon]
ATRSGIIISRELDVLVEIADVGLVEMSHGDVKADQMERGILEIFPFKRMKYSTEDTSKRELMWKALQYIRKDNPSDSAFPDIDFMKGYFEFVILDNEDIGFLDYKINETYLK